MQVPSTMFLCGKCSSQPSVVATMAGHDTQCLFFILDQLSHQRFLVDTGASISVFLASHLDFQSSQKRFSSSCHKWLYLQLLQNHHCLTVILGNSFIANVAKPLLSATFFHFGLLVDVCHCRLVDAATFTVMSLQTAAVSPQHLSHVSANGPYFSLLAHFIPTTGLSIHSCL